MIDFLEHIVDYFVGKEALSLAEESLLKEASELLRDMQKPAWLRKHPGEWHNG